MGENEGERREGARMRMREQIEKINEQRREDVQKQSWLATLLVA